MIYNVIFMSATVFQRLPQSKKQTTKAFLRYPYVHTVQIYSHTHPSFPPCHPLRASKAVWLMMLTTLRFPRIPPLGP